MPENNIANCLFSDSHKYESWVRIEREIVNFFCDNGILDDLQSRKAADFLSVGTFEILGLLKGDENEFERFVELILFKAPFLNSPYIIAFLDKYNFEGTSLSLSIRAFNDYLLAELNDFSEDLRKLAEDYKYVSQIGRTHGVHAEPTSAGHKFLICYSDIERNVEFIVSIRKYIELVLINYACCWDSNCSLELQNYLSLKLGLHEDTSFSNLCFKERYARYCSLLNSIAQNIYKLFLDLKFMSESELGEVSYLHFDDAFRNIETCSKIIEFNAGAFSLMIDAYDETELSNKFSEKRYLSEIASSLVSLIKKAREVFSGLQFNKLSLDSRLEESKELIYSQAFMLNILKKGTFSRDEVLEDLKFLSIKARSDGSSFSNMLLSSPKYKRILSEDDSSIIMSPSSYLRNIDAIYKRAFDNSLDLFKGFFCGKIEIDNIIDRVASQLNGFYALEREPVAIVAFSDRSLFILGALLLKLNFPLITIVFSSKNVLDCAVDNLVFDKSLIQAKRILIVDYSVMDSGIFLNSFIGKLKEMVFVKDVRIFSLLTGIEDEGFEHVWRGRVCKSNDDYSGFGRDSSNSGLACLPCIVSSQ